MREVIGNQIISTFMMSCEIVYHISDIYIALQTLPGMFNGLSWAVLPSVVDHDRD